MKYIGLTFLIFFGYRSFGQTPSDVYLGPINDNTYLSTIKISKPITFKLNKVIKNKKTVVDSLGYSTGTGFFVSRKIFDGSTRYFLVTNKHMIGDWSLNDTLIVGKTIIVGFYNDKNQFQNFNINLRENDKITNFVHPYPNTVVDVAVIDITQYLDQLFKVGIVINSIPIDNLVSANRLNDYGIFTGSQVLITGYPAGLAITSQNSPLVKSATIASPLRNFIDVIISMPNRNNQITPVNLTGKIILIDGYIVGGNSGGPVFSPILKATPELNGPLTKYNCVIGIVSSVYNNTGLSVVYSTDYIKDLIYQYTKN